MKLVIAGGGTGGHVFPGIAVAQALKKIDPSAEVLFVGTELGLEKNAVPKAGFAIEYVRVTGIKGRSLRQKLRSLIALPLALLSSIRILRRAKADAVLGVGGYASGPTLLAAWLLRIPVAICEPNSIPGFTNRILGYLSKRVYGAFDKTGQYFPKNTFEVVGNPIREEFSTQFQAAARKPQAQLQLVILGGSLGARPLNDVLPKTIALLKKQGLSLSVLHQSGKHDVERVRQDYANSGIEAEVTPFIDDVVATYLKADLLVCRSGATTCAEITAIGVPSIMVPFPHAIYDHQTENARELAEAGATVLLPQSQMTVERLAFEIFTLLSDSERRRSMAQAAQRLGKMNAAKQIAAASINRFSHQVLAYD